VKSKLDLPFTQQQRGQPHLWFCQAGWRIPDLRIRRNARSFITLWHNGETTCFKKKHPTTKKLLSGKMILIYLDFHPGPPDLFWKIYRKYKNVPKHLDDWMFWQLGMFCNLKRRWNADPWNFRNLRSMIQGRRAQGCTVSHGERWIPLPGDGRRGNQLLQHSWHHSHQGLLCACPTALGWVGSDSVGLRCCDVVNW